jgi:phosphatidylserine/phosphatidylglycerophosphate/cardiolipin synthase-like enzyme
MLGPAHWLSAFFLTTFIALFFHFARSESPDTVDPGLFVDHEDGAIEVFFSAPYGQSARTLRGGPDDVLASSISGARNFVDIAAYDLDLWSIRDALLEAHFNGVVVRMVVERGNYEQPEIEDLLAAGIDIVPDTGDALMHHKFVIVDGWDVWTGSMNFTLNGAYRNNNNLIHLQSSKLAKDFHREFNEMFDEGRFGRLSKRDTPFPEVRLGEAEIRVYFSPDDDALAGILQVLGRAEEQVIVMAYTLTADEIADALIELALEGQDVRLLAEADQIRSTGNDFERLKENGVDARTDINPYNMHHKVIVIDGRVVICGSYNFTRSAEERNDENLIIIKDESLADSYLIEFARLWEATS